MNNVAYWFNDDTTEIEMVNQSDGDNESQAKHLPLIYIILVFIMLSVDVDCDESCQHKIKEKRLDTQ